MEQESRQGSAAPGRKAGVIAPEDYLLMVDSVTDYAIFMLDPQGYILSWNEGARRLKGYEPAEIVGQHFSRFYPQEAIARHWPKHELEQAAAYGRFEDEGWRVRKDGSTFWASVTITRLLDESGGVRGFCKITRDLSVQREEEEAMRLSEERFRLLVEGVRDYAIFFLDVSGYIASWNIGAELNKGYKAQEIIGKHFSVFYPEELLKAGWPARELEIATADGRFEDEGWRVRKDGSRFWASVIITALHDSSGKHIGYAKITRDLTERKRVIMLEDEGRRINTFLAMLGHELRNPLAPISNALALMELDRTATETTRVACDIIGRQVRHMTRLVDDLLDVGRITSGKIYVDKKPVELCAIVAEAVETTAPLRQRKAQSLDLNLAPQHIWVLGDRARLMQVVSNLLTNASKFTGVGGQIGVSLAAAELHISLRVSDNGVGIAPDLLPYVFDLFVQGEQDAARGAGGLGLGLSLAKQLVLMHGGRIEARSAGPGQGSEFNVTLPSIEYIEPGLLAPAAREFRAQGKKILVVDDNLDAANTMNLLLRGMGYETAVAYEGHEAYDKIASERPDLVLLDLGLPGLSGHDIARRVMAEIAPPPLLVALTGYGQDKDRRESAALGFAAHMAKPAHVSQITELFERLFATRQAS